MQIRQLFYLTKIAECGSITSAAQQLYISQPSLTKSIAQLEKEYGIQIFVRKPNGVELTSQGKDFLYYAKVILNAADILDKVFSDRDSERKSQLFIASQQLDFLYSLVLETYRQNKGKVINGNIVEADRSDVVRRVLDGDVNIGIIVRSSSDSKSFLWHTEAKRLEIHTLDRAGVFACFGPKSPYYERDTITFAEARLCPQLALDIESDIKYDLNFNCTQSHFNMSSLICFNTISACERFLLETDSLLYIAKWAIGCFSETSIRAVSVISDLETRSAPITELLWLKRAGEPLNSMEKQFIQNLYAHFGKSTSEINL